MGKEAQVLVEVFGGMTLPARAPSELDLVFRKGRRPVQGGLWEAWGRARRVQGALFDRAIPGDRVTMHLVRIKTPWVPWGVLEELETRVWAGELGYWATPIEVQAFIAEHADVLEREGGPIVALGKIKYDVRGDPIARAYARTGKPRQVLVWPVNVHPSRVFHGSFRFLLVTRVPLSP